LINKEEQDAALLFWVKGFSVLEVAVEVPCFNNNQGAMWGVVFWRQCLRCIVIGCILILQADCCVLRIMHEKRLKMAVSVGFSYFLTFLDFNW
jgi:hypothetical protein